MKTRLHIHTGLRGNCTVLKNSFHTTPFKVANITEDKKAQRLDLMLMSSSPGILDGDEYNILIELDEGSNLHLQTQSYQRLFDMKQSASQHLEIRMQANSALLYLPHPAVPHINSSFSAVNNIYLKDDCKLIFGEILSCGRKLNGEIFAFRRYHNLTRIFINDTLVIKENLLVEPAITNWNQLGQLEGYTHQASLIYLHNNKLSKEKKKALEAFLSTENNIEYGLSEAPVDGLILRLLGQKAEQLHNILKKTAIILSGKTTTVCEEG